MIQKYQRLNLSERIQIEIGLSHSKSLSLIATELGRSKSTISREVAPWGKQKYNALKSHDYAERCSSLRKKNKQKIVLRSSISDYICEKLQLRWSPEQISKSLKNEFPNNTSMHVSHETIYRYIYLHCKKTLREELTKQLRRKKKTRGKSKAKAEDKRGRIPDAVSIDERPEEVLGREIPGHWEGDLVIGKGHKSAIGTLVERTTRTIIIVPLKSIDATHVREEFEKEFLAIPQQMRKTMTYDNGKEMTQHKEFTENTQIKVYFAHPYSPWERPTNENSNMLIRDYFPKGTDFNEISVERLKEVQNQLNTRPRKALDWSTPKEVFDRLAMVE